MGEPEPDTYTPHRPIRIEDPLWDAVGAVVGQRKRAALVRDLLRWWMRMPGAKLPPRPPRRD